MKYLFDTNICIYLIKNKPESVIKRFSKIQPETIAVSNITVAEMYYGIAKSSRPNENTVALEEFLLPLIIIDFNKNDARIYGKIRSELEKKRKMIGAMDLLIGAQALSRNLILVTNNVKEFRRIANLEIENWVSSK
ncbi:MAG: type II toxin-antitoxin system VapC family toxin [Melioribacteraceae bacterium]